MKILLILASDLVYKYENIFSLNNGFAPLSLTTLAASVPEKYNAEIKIIDEGMQKLNYNKLDYDIVGISCCASSSNRAYELAEYWKNRGAYTIIGGYHATLNPEEVSKHCDSVICGFGENVFPEVLEDFVENKTRKIYYAECKQNTPLPLPRRDLIKNINYGAKNTIFATRGCINKCKYCSVNKFTNSNLIKRPISEIVDEIKLCKFKKLFFLDSNFTADKEYAKELMSALIPLKIKYYADVTYDIYNDSELMLLLKKSGCFEVFIGFETSQKSNLKFNNKNNETEKYRDCINRFHELDISITGGFMLGMDNDTEEVILNLPEYVKELGVDVVRYTIYTPIPGTTLFDEYKNNNRLLTLNYDYYDYMHIVHKPLNIEPQRLQELFAKIWKETYLHKNILNRIYGKKDFCYLYMVNLYFKLLQRTIPTKLPY